MFLFFTPTTKVQKDRRVMRDTDARVAKYSRRGLVLNFIVFALCLFFGDFSDREHSLAIVLITGLLLVTLLRSYYLFRFDVLYARAPSRWRNQYFVASCLGAAWWSFILVSLTSTQGMRDETLIMWLYSVVFYSSVANVFAPYRRFLTLYLFIGQVPAAVTAILLGTVEGYLYGFIMLMFFFMLSHQAKVTSIAYWERLEANFTLREHARGLEHEQRSSQEASELKNEFLSHLGKEFRTSLSDILGTLTLINDEQLSESQRELLFGQQCGGFFQDHH
jgi:signal transduction histidine kinase